MFRFLFILLCILCVQCVTSDTMTRNGYLSEGSKKTPKILVPETVHRGMVSPGGKSYYTFTMKKGPEFQIIVRNFPGVLKITSYNTDKSFTYWQSANKGATPVTVEGWFFATVGETYYFTVEEPHKPKNGTEYEIFIREYDHKVEQ